MRRQISLRTYRRIDLCIFCMLAFLMEALIVTAYSRWFPELPYTVSITGVLTAIALFRWGLPGILIAIVGGVSFCLFSFAQPLQYMIYVVGNVFALVMLVPLHVLGWEKLRSHATYCMAFGLGTVICMQTGRALISLFVGYAPAIALHFYLTDTLSGLFAIVIMWIARRLDGVLEEQIHYIQRQHKENETVGGTEAWQ